MSATSTPSTSSTAHGQTPNCFDNKKHRSERHVCKHGENCGNWDTSSVMNIEQWRGTGQLPPRVRPHATTPTMPTAEQLWFRNFISEEDETPSA